MHFQVGGVEADRILRLENGSVGQFNVIAQAILQLVEQILSREEDFCDSPWTVPTAPCYFIGEINERRFAVPIGKDERFPYILGDNQRAVSLNLPSVLGGRIHLPKNDAIILSLLSNSLAAVNLVLNLTS